jgi:hypothetical protein
LFKRSATGNSGGYWRYDAGATSMPQSMFLGPTTEHDIMSRFPTIDLVLNKNTCPSGSFLCTLEISKILVKKAQQGTTRNCERNDSMGAEKFGGTDDKMLKFSKRQLKESAS